MKIEINKLVSDKSGFKFLEKFAKNVLKLIKLDIPELSVAIVDDKKIIALNKKYKNHNYTTDVLAFDYGEIIICLDQAKRQAKELKHSLKDELTILLIHGILHLSGYKDETKTQRDAMMKKQDKILIKIKNSPRQGGASKEVWGKIKS